MALNPNVNCVARFRIEQNGYALSPLDTNARAGPQTISVCWDATGSSYGPVGGPGGVDPVSYCLNLLKALIVPQAPSGRIWILSDTNETDATSVAEANEMPAIQ